MDSQRAAKANGTYWPVALELGTQTRPLAASLWLEPDPRRGLSRFAVPYFIRHVCRQGRFILGLADRPEPGSMVSIGALLTATVGIPNSAHSLDRRSLPTRTGHAITSLPPTKG